MPAALTEPTIKHDLQGIFYIGEGFTEVIEEIRMLATHDEQHASSARASADRS